MGERRDTFARPSRGSTSDSAFGVGISPSSVRGGGLLLGQKLIKRPGGTARQPLDRVRDLRCVAVAARAAVVLVEVDQRAGHPLRKPEPLECATDRVVRSV